MLTITAEDGRARENKNITSEDSSQSFSKATSAWKYVDAEVRLQLQRLRCR